MSKRYVNESENPPEELIALANMFDIEWRYIRGYGARTWELWVVHPTRDLPDMSRRTQSTSYDDWCKIIEELIEYRDKQ